MGELELTSDVLVLISSAIQGGKVSTQVNKMGNFPFSTLARWIPMSKVFIAIPMNTFQWDEYNNRCYDSMFKHTWNDSAGIDAKLKQKLILA